MKNKLFIILSVLTSVFFTACQTENTIDSIAGPTLNKVEVGTLGSNNSSQILYAGQTINAGKVTYDDIDTDNNGTTDALQITYATTNGWELTEVQFFIGNSLADMPVNKSGNPQIGLFPYKSGNITGQTSYTIVIPFTTLGFTCPGPEDYVVAAHASVRKSLGGGSYQTETGWGDGARLVQRGNWAMYNTIYITCDVVLPPVLEVKTETAFAFDGDQSGCFANYSEFISNPNRWGWTNGPLTAGVYDMPIYAGAGQCDITKGTLVGNLNVNYNGSTAVVTYTLNGNNPSTGLPYTLEEVHLYVGSEEFPRNKQNELTIAPGQYPKKASDLNGQTYTFTVNNLSGSVYVIAHAVVYGFPASSN